MTVSIIGGSFKCVLMSSPLSSAFTRHVKQFVFTENSNSPERYTVEIIIPEQLSASYSFYTWPCAPYLAWYLFDHRKDLLGKHVLELGAGTSLPSLVAAKCGAKVTISDSALLPKTLQNIHHICQANQLDPESYQVIGLSWGYFLNQTFELSNIDLIIASDCFYEPLLFEDILVTVSFLLNCHPRAVFLCAYQERSADWTIEHLLNKWSLGCRHIDLSSLGTNSVLNSEHVIQHHTIHIVEIYRLRHI